MTDAVPHRRSSTLSRRGFLRTSAGLAAAVPLAAATTQLVARSAFAAPVAQSASTVSWQLGWTKSVQFGGFFAAIDKGFYAEEGINPDVRAGGPQINPISQPRRASSTPSSARASPSKKRRPPLQSRVSPIPPAPGS